MHGIRCTLVEPRPLKLSKPQLKQLQAAGRAPCIQTTTAAQLEQQQQCSSNASPLAEPPAQAAAEAAADEAAADEAAAEPLELHQARLWAS